MGEPLLFAILKHPKRDDALLQL